MKLPILAVLPAFNEETRIAPVVRACLEHVEKVAVIDDGSDDHTREAAEQAGAEVIRHPVNRGKGAAIRTAFDLFRSQSLSWLVLLDSDGQHDPAEIPMFYERAVEGNHDIVLGDRMSDTSRMPPVRIATNRFMSWLLSRLAGQCMPDTQCGYRLFSRRAVDSFRLTTTHYDLESELLIQAARAGFSIGSCPIRTIYGDQTSHINPIVDTIRFIRLVLRSLGNS